MKIDERGRKGAGSAMQSALLLFLYSSFSQDESYLHRMAQPLVTNMIAVLSDIWQTPFINTTFWPLFIIASYCDDVEQQNRIMESLPPIPPILVRAAQIFRWVWQKPKGLLGLHGLARH